MPLTPFQRGVLRVIANNRSVESHVAGGIALNSEAQSPRSSKVIDIFHDAEEALESASVTDCATLAAAGHEVERKILNITFRPVLLLEDGEQLNLEWALDSAWRFFPIERDPVLMWKLHRFDALTNKALAMAGRSETSDLVDLVMNHATMPLCAIVWAACSKDPVWQPMSLLEQMRRNSKIDPGALKKMGAAMTPVELKQHWLKLAEETESEILRAVRAHVEIGVVFLAPDGSVAWFDTPGATIHRAALGGVIPRIGDVRYEL